MTISTRLRPWLQALLVALLLMTVSVEAQVRLPLNTIPSVSPKPVDDEPSLDFLIHKVNRMALMVTNNGTFGGGSFLSRPFDPETGRIAMSCEYPVNSHIEYLWTGALWFGAIVGRDTVVSIGADTYYHLGELWPDVGASDRMIRRSSRPHSIYYSPDAVSEEDVIAHFTDTATNFSYIGEDPIDNRPHQPLGLDITQTSYAWSYPYAEDFILLDYNIRNVGQYPIRKLYIGVVVQSMVFHTGRSLMGPNKTWKDDICGYKETIPSQIWPGYEDTIRIAWVADNDGDPNGIYDGISATSVTGTRVIRTPSDSLDYSFNWWVTGYSPSQDWGPRQVTEDKPYHNFGHTFGTPLGDINKYYILSTPEFDYDQLECAIPHTGEGWLSPPPAAATDYADGHNPIYLLSFGPFDIEPGDSVPMTMAYIAGEDFHHNPYAYQELLDPYNPKAYQDQLDFSDFGLNSVWADWIYDNPGYDTDGDGDSGQARWNINSDGSDSVYEYYRGDGVPDFRGAAPPPSPKLSVNPGEGRVTLRWNGQLSENDIDVFSKHRDFEGYKVYFAEDNRHSDFVLAASYDVRDYNRYRWNEARRRWDVSPIPLSYDSLVQIYGPGVEPDEYTIDHPMTPTDSRNPEDVYTYFTPQHWNQSDFGDPRGIRKVYPDADLNDSTDVNEDGLHRYYEYEYVLDNLPPSRHLYVSVTAFDFGSRTHRLSALESSVMENHLGVWPLPSAEDVESEGLGVVVYPNPYRIEGGYAAAGYENRDRTRSAERTRQIHFINLPRICTIRIHTLSGDLVKEIKHYYPEGGGEAQEETWNMLSRNTQAIVTGIYIWTVSSEMGDQIGKLVILK